MKFIRVIRSSNNELQETTQKIHRLLEEQLNPYMGGILNTKTFDKMLQLAQTSEDPEDKNLIELYTKLKEVIKPLEDFIKNN